MTEQNDWSEFIPPERAIELAGKWKHGYIPLDAVALKEKMHGRTGGKKWWDGPGAAEKARPDSEAMAMARTKGETKGKA